jgi:hypothetical protein
MDGGRESRRPRPALGCSVIDDDKWDTRAILIVCSVIYELRNEHESFRDDYFFSSETFVLGAVLTGSALEPIHILTTRQQWTVLLTSFLSLSPFLTASETVTGPLQAITQRFQNFHSLRPL